MLDGNGRYGARFSPELAPYLGFAIGELVVDASLDGSLDLVVTVVEVAAADRGGELRVVVEAERVQALEVRGLLLRAELELALHHVEDVHRDAGVELHPSLRRRHDVALEELAHCLDQLGRGRAIVGRGHGSSSNRSCSFSHTRRPMAASSTERLKPSRWDDACMMQMTPHFNVPKVSHQRTTSGSTSVPDADE